LLLDLSTGISEGFTFPITKEMLSGDNKTDLEKERNELFEALNGLMESATLHPSLDDEHVRVSVRSAFTAIALLRKISEVKS